MLISDKQQEANRQNAQQSSGPKTPEGKAAVRLNALTFGLRTRATILARENAADYSQLWDEFEADCRVAPGSFTPRRSQIPCVSLSTHTARATQRRLPPPIRTIEFLRLPVDPLRSRCG
jgi:hypothetical protein